jgi:hypothetical protein
LARASGAVGRLAAPGERTIGDAVGDFLHSDPVEKLTQPFIAESGVGSLLLGAMRAEKEAVAIQQVVVEGGRFQEPTATLG